MDKPANLKIIRRNNLRKLAKEFGSIGSFAKHLNKGASQLSHLIGTSACKNIGDNLAAKIEQTLNLPTGWLDIPHEGDEVDEPEDRWVSLSNVPLLLEQEVLPWLRQPNRSSLQRQVYYVKTNLKLDKYAFALRVQNDVMEAPSGKSIPRDSIVIADPDSTLKNNDCVVICLGKSLPQITQLVQEGSRKYLKPQNPCYPVTELTSSNYTICGVLRQVTFNL